MDVSLEDVVHDHTITRALRELLQVAPLWEAQFTIEAGRPAAQEAKLLGLAPGDPCLIVVRRTVSRGAPVTLVRLVHPGTHYKIEGRFEP
jgi:GntR family histidine utilization transcriptional repressor